MSAARADYDAVVICGPTASGKTRMAVECARSIDGEIISADSRQVYRGMDLGTGKDLDEYGSGLSAVPVHCIDCAEPHEIYTLWHYQQDCYRALEQIHSRGKIPILAGGTGLYIEAVLKHYRLANVPENPGLRETLMQRDRKTLLNQLKELDPQLYTSTDHSSRKRIVRAIEICRYGQSHTIEWGCLAPPPITPRIVVLTVPRSVLHERIRMRLIRRLQSGMIDEVERLLEQGVSRERMELFGMEYRHITRYLDKKVSYDSMVESLYGDIRRLAKRQETWFRGMPRRGLNTVVVVTGSDPT